jgi:hypothetical protein
MMITSGKERMHGSEQAIWIERITFWTEADHGSPAKWIQQHYLQSQVAASKFLPAAEHTGYCTRTNRFIFV